MKSEPSTNSAAGTSGEPCKKCVFTSSYRLFACAASYLQSPLLLAIRLYWGWHFFLTGKGKLMNLDRTAEFFQSLHIPMPKLNACLAGGTECFGGLLLLVGLGSRLVSVPLIFTMIIAYVTAEQEAVKNIFKDPDKFVTATPFLFMYAAVIILAFGPGKFSIDWLIGKKLSSKPRL